MCEQAYSSVKLANPEKTCSESSKMLLPESFLKGNVIKGANHDLQTITIRSIKITLLTRTCYLGTVYTIIVCIQPPRDINRNNASQ